MIRMANGFSFLFMVASGALGFDGRGWFWERPLVWLGLIDPSLFAVVLKTLTLKPRKGNLRWWKPWECVALIKGGAVNKVGLTNPGINYWINKVWPRCRGSFFISLYGDEEELSEMVRMLVGHWESFPWARPTPQGVEINVSCPNSGDALSNSQKQTEQIIRTVKEVRRFLPQSWSLIVKLSVTQDYVSIAKGIGGCADAVSINSVPWEKIYPARRSPLFKLQSRLNDNSGGGGVSGVPAQRLNWEAVAKIRRLVPELPVIGPSVMSYDDVARVQAIGAKAVSFGAIHLPDYPVWLRPWTIFTNPCRPTVYVRRWQQEKGLN